MSGATHRLCSEQLRHNDRAFTETDCPLHSEKHNQNAEKPVKYA
jgi:hypothetical protein